MNYEQVLLDASARLNSAGIDGGARDARLLLFHLKKWSSSELVLNGQNEVPTEVLERFEALVERRLQAEPVFRIIGEREFHGLPFELSRETLEPRDDTETLVSLTLDAIEDRNAELSFADLGTGTGIIAISLLTELPAATCVAVDLSEDALNTATRNALRNSVASRFMAAHGTWLKPLEGRFDFIVSNPPYIESKVMAELSREVREYDPALALDGGDDGLNAYREILQDGARYLKTRGFLALEIGYDQRDAIVELSDTLGWHVEASRTDLGGKDRALLLRPDKNP